jgi:pimeloyl-ACP methyl ester carboxylesterase
MAGGTAVIVAAGVSLGGSLGAVTATAYLRDDKSFRIEKLQDGTGTPVLVASGFLTEGESGWGSWEQLITDRYPDAPVYRVYWGAKELRALGVMGGSVGAKAVATTVLKQAARLGSKDAAGAVPYLGAVFIAQSALANPWSVAKSRADKTAGILADLLARTDSETFVLVGHSLGARVMLRTAELLASRSGPPALEAVHLLGAAVGAKGDWVLLNTAVTDRVWNYWSSHDAVLKYAYRGAQLGQSAAGRVGFRTTLPRIKDVDVSATVATHGAYFQGVKLRGKG